MSPIYNSKQTILEHPTHIIKETKRKLTLIEGNKLEEFIKSRGILVDYSITNLTLSKAEKLTIIQGSKTLLQQFKEYKENKNTVNYNNIIQEDMEMTMDENTNSTETKSFSEAEVLKLISAALEQQQQQ